MSHPFSANADSPQGGLLGRVLSSRGAEARLGLLPHPAQAKARATIGKFVAIDCGGSRVVGIISEVFTPGASDPQGDYGAIARVDLVGELTHSGGQPPQFRRGVRHYPAIGDAASTLSREDLRLIYAPAGARAIAVGELHQDGSIEATVDAEALISKHFAVLGSTGVGKSSGVAVLLGELKRVRPDVRVLLLDVHNEYGRSLGADTTVIGSDTLRLPFWLLNLEEITDVLYGGKPAVLEEVEILAELIPAAKGMYQGYKGAGERSLLARRTPKSSGYTADTPAPYLIQDLIGLIDERMGKLENRATRMVHHRLLQRIESIRNDPRYAFMFENANVGGDIMVAVLNQLFRLDRPESGPTVLGLASLPGEVVDAVVCVISRLAFEFGMWSDGAIPIRIGCEEAHRYAARDHSLGFAPARRALSRVAKEGRKYGVYLGLVTQRPAEIDPTIISQCSTLFFMRMANDEDQSILRSASSDAAQSLLSFVPSLGMREVIGIGEGMPLPARFSFKTLPAERLLGGCCDAGLRQGSTSCGDIVAATVERWRQATTNTARLKVEDEERGGDGSLAAIRRELRSFAAEGRPADTGVMDRYAGPLR